jgi:RNA 3'-terminal phosphate cyclase
MVVVADLGTKRVMAETVGLEATEDLAATVDSEVKVATVDSED